MKTKLLVIIAILFSYQSFSQAYIPFQFGNTRWKYAELNFSYTRNYCYFSTDTNKIIINGHNYLPIEKSNSPVSFGGVYQYIYDDTSNRKVFVFNPIDSAINLLYDFSAQAGDTIRGIYNYNLLGNFAILDTIKIDSIITKNVNAINRKFFYFSHIGNWGLKMYYVEGIGSMYDLFSPTKYMATDPDFMFNCYQNNNHTAFPDTSNGDYCLNFLTSTIEVEKQSQISVSTISNTGLYEIINPNNKYFTWKLYNFTGQLIAENKTNQINISSSPTGIYLLQIQTKNSSKTFKLIKK